MPDTSLIHGPDRTENITKALQLLKKAVNARVSRLGKDDYVLVKPNLLTAKRPLAVTHIQTMDALLGFLRTFYKGKIIVAEGTSIGSTEEAFRNYGYHQLQAKYGVELVDLNHDEGIAAEAYDRNLNPVKVLVARTVAQAGYRISVAPIKTHNSLILSLGIENMVTGSLLKGGSSPVNAVNRVIFRRRFHDYKAVIAQGYVAHNLSIAKLAPALMPDLSILDGHTAMERNGPVGGQESDLQIVIAGTDAIAVDALAAYLTGFDPGHIGYLHHLNVNQHEIRVVGEKISACRQKLRPHDNYQEQLRWYDSKTIALN